MKKSIIIFILIILIYILIGNVIAEKDIIPDEAIRIRVIANSNSEYDQNIKIKVKDNLQSIMYKLLKNTEDIESARNIIKNNINLVEDDIYTLLQEEKYYLPFNVNL